MVNFSILASASSTISSDDEDDKNNAKKAETFSSKEFSPLNRHYGSDRNGELVFQND